MAAGQTIAINLGALMQDFLSANLCKSYHLPGVRSQDNTYTITQTSNNDQVFCKFAHLVLTSASHAICLQCIPWITATHITISTDFFTSTNKKPVFCKFAHLVLTFASHAICLECIPKITATHITIRTDFRPIF